MAPVKDALLRTANYDRNVDRGVVGIMAGIENDFSGMIGRSDPAAP
jgi:hypothetical protein